MISYSSYDTQDDPANFAAALKYLASQHNRTADAPEGNSAVFVAEYGYAQNHVPNATLAIMVQNVVNTALEFGVSYILFWETMDNECLGGPGCSSSSSSGVAPGVEAAGLGHRPHQVTAAVPELRAAEGAAAEGVAQQLGTGRCYGPTPVTDPSMLNGFWLVKPDGSKAWSVKNPTPNKQTNLPRAENLREDADGLLYQQLRNPPLEG